MSGFGKFHKRPNSWPFEKLGAWNTEAEALHHVEWHHAKIGKSL